MFISIHAPQWGATTPDAYPQGWRKISIHAPQWGATRRTECYQDVSYNFNPRTPVGCDLPQP